jgi:hypothetical protein
MRISFLLPVALAACSGTVQSHLAQLNGPSLQAELSSDGSTIELHVSTQVNGAPPTDVGATCSALGDDVIVTLDGNPMPQTDPGGPWRSVKGYVWSCEDIVYTADAPAASEAVSTFTLTDSTATFELSYAALMAVRGVTTTDPTAASGVLTLQWAPASDSLSAEGEGGDWVALGDGGSVSVQSEYAGSTISVTLPPDLEPGADAVELYPCFTPAIVACDGGAACKAASRCLDGVSVDFTLR